MLLFPFFVLLWTSCLLAKKSDDDEPPLYPDWETIVEEESPRWKLGKMLTKYKHRNTSHADFWISSEQCGRDSLIMDRLGWMKLGNESAKMDMWFWNWEAPHQTNRTPIVLYLPDGPGMSGMLPMFDGTGPCLLGERKGKTHMNQWSFNDDIDMIYVDSPIPVGWSMGDLETTTRAQAVDLLYEFLQQYIRQFPQYRRRRFHIWSSGYSSTFAVALAAKILKANTKILNLKKAGKEDLSDPNRDDFIILASLGMDSPSLDLSIQHRASIEYARKNDVRTIIGEADYQFLKHQYAGMYEYVFRECGRRNTDKDCSHVWKDIDLLLGNLTEGGRGTGGEQPRPNFSPFNIRVARESTSPEAINRELLEDPVMEWFDVVADKYKIDKGPWYPASYQPLDVNVTRQFKEQGDIVSSLEDLSWVVASNVKTLVMGGDADLVTAWQGLKEIAETVSWDHEFDFKHKPSEHFKVTTEKGIKQSHLSFQVERQLTAVADIKRLKNLTWMKIWRAGHIVANYQPHIVTEIFKEHIWDGVKYPAGRFPMDLKAWKCSDMDPDCLTSDHRDGIHPPAPGEVDY